MVLAFLGQTFIALTERSSRGAKSNLAFLSMVPLDFWSWVSAAETAAWRLKWIMIPLTLLVAFGGRKLYRSIVQSPASFCGARYARGGLLASATIPLLILVLIGVTVPERLRHRQDGIRAGEYAQGYRIDRALSDYREEFGTLPSELKDLRRLPDADGTLAAALVNINSSGYDPSAVLASASREGKPQAMRVSALRKASFNQPSHDPLDSSLSFTNYELRLPGPDKILGTPDDFTIRDGVIVEVSGTVKKPNTAKASGTTTTRQ